MMRDNKTVIQQVSPLQTRSESLLPLYGNKLYWFVGVTWFNNITCKPETKTNNIPKINTSISSNPTII